MPRFRPDPTFYASPSLAGEAPPEQLAYVALLATRDGQRDALGVVDTNPESSAFGRLVGQADFPQGGNELHHFGWNACSSHLCPYAPNAHVERRYLVVPGTHSSRIHILDTKPDPRDPRLVKVIEGEEVMAKTGLRRPAHRALRPGRDLPERPRRPERRRTGRDLHPRPRDLRREGTLGAGPRPAVPGLRLLLAPGPGHDDHERVGYAEHGEGRRQPGAAARGQVRAQAPRLGPAPAHAPRGARPRRPAPDGARAPAGPQPEPRPRLRRGGDLAGGPLELGVPLVPRPERAEGEGRVADAESDHDPRRPGRRG